MGHVGGDPKEPIWDVDENRYISLEIHLLTTAGKLMLKRWENCVS